MAQAKTRPAPKKAAKPPTCPMCEQEILEDEDPDDPGVQGPDGVMYHAGCLKAAQREMGKTVKPTKRAPVVEEEDEEELEEELEEETEDEELEEEEELGLEDKLGGLEREQIRFRIGINSEMSGESSWIIEST